MWLCFGKEEIKRLFQGYRTLALYRHSFLEIHSAEVHFKVGLKGLNSNFGCFPTFRMNNWNKDVQQQVESHICSLAYGDCATMIVKAK